MTDQQVQNTNRLIAKFMCPKYQADIDGGVWIDELGRWFVLEETDWSKEYNQPLFQPDKSFDWIMPVAAKIKKLWKEAKKSEDKELVKQWSVQWQVVKESLPSFSSELICEACVHFIQWYNEK